MTTATSALQNRLTALKWRCARPVTRQSLRCTLNSIVYAVALTLCLLVAAIILIVCLPFLMFARYLYIKCEDAHLMRQPRARWQL